MDLKKAQEINKACVDHVLFHLEPHEEPPSLKDYSLRDLLEAKKIVQEINKARTDGIHHIVCDDRLLAALYVAYHFPGEDPMNATCVCIGDGKAVVVVKTG